MQLTRQKPHFARPQLNLAAMIDVVFLVLIFFLCTSSFHVPDHLLATELPGSKQNTQAGDLGPIRINISTMPDGILITCDDLPCVNIDDLTRMLKARRQIADLPVIIQGRPNVPFDAMAAALNACRRANLNKAAFSLQGAAP